MQPVVACFSNYYTLISRVHNKYIQESVLNTIKHYVKYQLYFKKAYWSTLFT